MAAWRLTSASCDAPCARQGRGGEEEEEAWCGGVCVKRGARQGPRGSGQAGGTHHLQGLRQRGPTEAGVLSKVLPHVAHDIVADVVVLQRAGQGGVRAVSSGPGRRANGPSAPCSAQTHRVSTACAKQAAVQGLHLPLPVAVHGGPKDPPARLQAATSADRLKKKHLFFFL